MGTFGERIGTKSLTGAVKGTESLSGPHTLCFENGQTKELNQGEEE